ncbi:hypothetical protein BDQ12DRAFT_685836 [Crucibulum laeve]|uniref:Mediator of RNA polymerase II transcription subunit 8 n=1 Tax=Crucibulum laeve TaxID=68775 RepID=A0A5C3LVB7_9AGAR|nr:hypothetical protein BDQ12DRAFT_685836 [Crucibulum laeve]
MFTTAELSSNEHPCIAGVPFRLSLYSIVPIQLVATFRGVLLSLRNLHIPLCNLNMSFQTTASDVPPLPIPNLPVSQLESLRFKANQIIESIQALQWTIEAGGNPGAMPAWPDILSKYNILLSQTHSFSNSLVNPITSHSQAPRPGQPIAALPNMFERIALHPSEGMPDSQLDSEVIPLLRNQQTTDVLRMENDTVRRLSEHMSTRGSLGVLGVAPPPQQNPPNAVHLNGFNSALHQRKPEYEDVLRECAEIRDAHDRRVERAVRAVTMLREKFEWKQRVEVEVEEPEELEWDPRLGKRDGGEAFPDVGAGVLGEDVDVGMESGDQGEGDEKEESSDEKGGSSDEDEVNVEGELVDSGGMEGQSPAPNDLFSPSTSVNGSGADLGAVTNTATSGDVAMEGIS